MHALGPLFWAEDLSFLEFYAGEGRVWRALRADSVDAVGVDIGYFNAEETEGSSNAFDILSCSGFA